MKTRYLITLLLLLVMGTGAAAQNAVPDTLLFVFKLHGQTRKYQMCFTQRNDSVVLDWRILRNLRWQKGTYTMTPASLAGGNVLSSLMPEDGRRVVLPGNETAYLISDKAYRELKETRRLAYNCTEYELLDADEQACGYALLHVRDQKEGAEVWILDDPDWPLVWRMRNNPLEINWEVQLLK